MATENKNPHSGHRERMRKKFLDNDIDVFSDHEILEFLLYYMVRPEYQLHVREAIYLDNMLDLF